MSSLPPQQLRQRARSARRQELQGMGDDRVEQDCRMRPRHHQGKPRLESRPMSKSRLAARNYASYSNNRIVISDDSSEESNEEEEWDQEDILSRTSSASRMTIHREKNGIWVSSDEDSGDESEESETKVTKRLQPPVQRRNSMKRLPTSTRHHVEYQSDGSASYRSAHENNKPLHVDSTIGMMYKSDSHHKKYSPASAWSSGSSTTTGTKASAYWSTSESESSPRRSTFSRRRSTGEMFPTKPATLKHFPQAKHVIRAPSHGYESFESISLSSDHEKGYSSAASSVMDEPVRIRNRSNSSKVTNLRRAATLRRTSSLGESSYRAHSSPLITSKPQRTITQQQSGETLPGWTTQVATSTSQQHSSSWTTQMAATSSQQLNSVQYHFEQPASQPSPPQSSSKIQLHSVQFWDPDGSKAWFAECGSYLSGLGLTLVCFSTGSYIGAIVLLAFTVLFSSYFSTMFRLLRWRKYSGIEHQALFNDLYETVEAVATDTRTAMPTGEMKTRLVCAGELGNAIRRHATMLDEPTRLRFWVEACVHFRLTLRNGCHHIGNGRLPPKTLSSASLALYSHHLPVSVCSSCDNKIAIESKFPLKCD